MAGKSAKKKGGKPRVGKGCSTPPKVVPFPEFCSGFFDELDQDEPRETRVELAVSGERAAARKVQRWLEKHFRKIPSVFLTSESPQFVVDVAVVLDESDHFSLSHFIGAKVSALLGSPEDVPFAVSPMIIDLVQRWLDVTEHNVQLGHVELLEEACVHMAEHFRDEYVARINEIADILAERVEEQLRGG